MKFSVITLTAGRVEHLNECIESFLRQDYPEKELIVLNTMPQQTLLGVFPNVRIINLKVRPPNLGAARNLAIQECSDDSIICMLDDDDLALPCLLSEYAHHFENPETKWVWVDREFYLERSQIRKIATGMCNTFAFTKSAWKSVGGYDPVNVGEDRAFIGKLTSKHSGIKASVPDDRIGYLYCWGNGVYHVSGQGSDSNSRVNSWERSRIHLASLLSRHIIPHGEIQLQPKWRQDYSALAASFLGTVPRSTRNSSRPEVCIIQLGRYGDIINILPFAQLIAERWGKPAFMVSQEFADVLSGVSYVIPEIVRFPYGELHRAVEMAKQYYKISINTQIWGLNYQQAKETEAYNMESWRMAGLLNRFNDRTLLPVFDKRNPDVEAGLHRRISDGKPMLLVKLTGGISSPFNGASSLHARIVKAFGETHQVVDLSNVKAGNLHDLLGLLDRAAALVSVDTATLHLAAASGVPVVALINPMPWNGSAPRCNTVATWNYNDVQKDIDGVIAATTIALNSPPKPMPEPAVINPPVRRLFHAVERHNEARNPRKEMARKSWDVLYDNGVIPRHYWEYKRDARDIGDRRALPYLKDVLAFSGELAGPEDIIFFTNDDNVLHPDLASYLKFHVAAYGPCSAQRREVREPIPRLPHPIPLLAKLGVNHGGRDLFAFTKVWLDSVWDGIPDYILGASDWDWGLASLIRLRHGISITRKNIETSIYPAEIPQGYVLHQFHPPTWMRPENELRAPSQKHNRLLFKQWAAIHLPSLQFTPENRL